MFSTGIAASIIVRGRQIRGCHFNAGEVGHMRVGVSVGVSCARLLCNQYDTRLLIPGDDECVLVEEVFRLSREGDPLCVKLVENAVAACSYYQAQPEIHLPAGCWSFGYRRHGGVDEREIV